MNRQFLKNEIKDKTIFYEYYTTQYTNNWNKKKMSIQSKATAAAASTISLWGNNVSYSFNEHIYLLYVSSFNVWRARCYFVIVMYIFRCAQEFKEHVKQRLKFRFFCQSCISKQANRHNVHTHTRLIESHFFSFVRSLLNNNRKKV